MPEHFCERDVALNQIALVHLEHDAGLDGPTIEVPLSIQQHAKSLMSGRAISLVVSVILSFL